MEAARFPHALSMGLRESCQVSAPLRRTSDPYRYSTPKLNGTPWILTGLRSTDINDADKNIYYTSIHHVSRTDRNCAVLKRAENIMRHVEMWSVVSQKETVRASRKMCSGLKDSVAKSLKFISWVKRQKQRIMLARSAIPCVSDR